MRIPSLESARAPGTESQEAESKLATVIRQQEKMKDEEEIVRLPHLSMRLLKDARSVLPAVFLEHPFEYALEHGCTLKDEPKREEIIWSLPATHPHEPFVLKRVQYDKKHMPSIDYELRILQRAAMLNLPAPTPLGLMQFENNGPVFLIMKFIEGISGVDLYEKLRKQGKNHTEAERDIEIVCEKLAALAQQFREQMHIDKKWYIKDCMIYFDSKGNVADIFPLDWELAHAYDPHAPEAIDTLAKVRERLTKKGSLI